MLGRRPCPSRAGETDAAPTSLHTAIRAIPRFHRKITRARVALQRAVLRIRRGHFDLVILAVLSTCESKRVLPSDVGRDLLADPGGFLERCRDKGFSARDLGDTGKHTRVLVAVGRIEN